MNVTKTGMTRAERLDRLSFNRRHFTLLGGSGAGWALDAMDVGLISFVLAALKVQWDLTNGEMSWIASIGFVGMAIGASLGGLLADKIGRRQVFALTLLIYGLATGASALAGSVAVLLVFRFLVGLGLGAELPIASTLVSEFAPAKIRGRLVVILEAFWAVGWVLAALIGYFVVPQSANGWRWALAIGALPAFYSIVVRLGLPESVRFLESKGRTEEAEAAVRSFEEPAQVAPVESPPAEVAPSPGPGALWASGMRRRTAAIWLAWFFINFAYYGAFIWLPSILVADGFSLVRSFGFTLVITLAQLPGYALAAFLIEVWGRRATLASFLAGSAVSAALFAFAGGETSILVAGMLLSFFNLGAWGALYAVTPEIYPTILRGTGTGWAAGFGRIASIVTPLLMPAMLAAGGREFAFIVFGVAFVAAMLAALNLPEMRGRALTEVEDAA